MKIYFSPNASRFRTNACLRHIASIVLLALLCGCSSLRYFRGSEFPGFNSDTYAPECKKTQVCMARQFARDRAGEYRCYYTSLKKENTLLFDLPLIGLATAIAGNVLYGNIVDLTKGLGLAAATVTGLRTYSNNTQKAGFFLLAEEAAQCLVEKSAPFIDAQDAHERIKKAAEEIWKTLVSAQDLLPKLDDSWKEKEALQSAITLGLSSIELASGALRAIDDSSNKLVDSIYVIDRKLTSDIEKASPDVDAIFAKIQSTAQTLAKADIDSDTINNESKNVATTTKGLLQPKNDRGDAVRYAQEIKVKGDIINKFAPIYIRADSDLSVCSAKL